MTTRWPKELRKDEGAFLLARSIKDKVNPESHERLEIEMHLNRKETEIILEFFQENLFSGVFTFPYPKSNKNFRAKFKQGPVIKEIAGGYNVAFEVEVWKIV